MRERFAISPVLFGALLLYAALTTLLPSLVFRRPMDVDPLSNESPAPVDAVVVREDPVDAGNSSATSSPNA